MCIICIFLQEVRPARISVNKILLKFDRKRKPSSQYTTNVLGYYSTTIANVYF